LDFAKVPGANFSLPAPALFQLTKQSNSADYLVFLIVQSKKFQKIAGDNGLSETFWMLLDHALMSGNWNRVALDASAQASLSTLASSFSCAAWSYVEVSVL
jgi:hypothetical protein